MVVVVVVVVVGAGRGGEGRWRVLGRAWLWTAVRVGGLPGIRER